MLIYSGSSSLSERNVRQNQTFSLKRPPKGGENFEGKQRETCKCVLDNGYEQQGVKLPKYNLGYNTRDQLRSLAISASERKQLKNLFFKRFLFYVYLVSFCEFTKLQKSSVINPMVD